MSGSADLKTVKIDLHRRSEYKRHLTEMEKERKEYRQSLNTLVKKNEQELKNIKKAYDVKIGGERANLERDFIKVRSDNKRKMKEETDRLSQMEVELRGNHNSQMDELKETFSKEVERYDASRQEYLDNAKNKYELEKAKLNA